MLKSRETALEFQARMSVAASALATAHHRCRSVCSSSFGFALNTTTDPQCLDPRIRNYGDDASPRLAHFDSTPTGTLTISRGFCNTKNAIQSETQL